MLPRRLTHTYSIVAADPLTGELGIAVQSHWFCVGASVVWAEPGVGVMAVQADADPAYGGAGLAHLAGGLTADAVLRRLLQDGPRPDAQQLAVLDCRGGVAVHTGGACLAFAGHRRGATYAAQANMMLRSGTWDALAAGFEAAGGSLAERLLAALAAGEAQGGDLRGRQSAALVVVRPDPTGDRRHDRPVDLRVDDHADPLAELARLLAMRQATDLANKGFEQLWQGEPAAAAEFFIAAAAVAPAQSEFAFWAAWALDVAGQPGPAAELLRPILHREPCYAILFDRLAASEKRSVDAALARLLDEFRPTH